MADRRTRRVEDAGEKVVGSRKDFARERMTVSDLAPMTEVEMVNKVKRDNVWPKPDFEALVAAGMEPMAAAYVSIVRDRIAAEPRVLKAGDHTDTMRYYVETLETVRAALEACKTADEVRNAFDPLHERVSRRKSDPAFFQAEGKYRWDILRRETARRNPVAVDAIDDPIKARRLLGMGFPSEIPAWRRGFVVREYKGDWMVLRSKYVIAGGFSSEEATLDWLKKKYAAEKAEASMRRSGTGDTKRVPERPHLDRLSRYGLPDWRSGTDVSPQTFIDVFGYRGIVFGEWLPDDERQKTLNHGYDALMDFAHVLGMEPGQLSLDGTLSISFGARGQGNHAAHYESEQRIINMTRLTGAGFLAHEYGHALDHWLGTGSTVPVAGGIKSATGWRTRLMDCRPVLAHRSEAVAQYCHDTIAAFFTRPKTRDERRSELEERVTSRTRKIAALEARLAPYLERDDLDRREKKIVKDLHKELEPNRTGLTIFSAQLEAVGSLPEGDPALERTDSDYLVASASISGPKSYWTRPNELFARAFEAFVFDTLADNDAVSDYLVHHVDETAFDKDHYVANPYPVGRERKLITDGFASIVANVVPLISNASRSQPVHRLTEAFDPR
jgi:hypothetical protein